MHGNLTKETAFSNNSMPSQLLRLHFHDYILYKENNGILSPLHLLVFSSFPFISPFTLSCSTIEERKGHMEYIKKKKKSLKLCIIRDIQILQCITQHFEVIGIFHLQWKEIFNGFPFSVMPPIFFNNHSQLRIIHILPEGQHPCHPQLHVPQSWGMSGTELS